MIVTILKIKGRITLPRPPTRTPAVVELVSKCKSEGKMLAESTSRTEDLLTTTYQAIWAKAEDYIEFINNPAVIEYTEDRGQHNLTYGLDTEFQILNYED